MIAMFTCGDTRDKPQGDNHVQAGVLRRRTGEAGMTAPAQVHAVGYVRVSSEDQAREGVSLAAQAERIAAYAAAKGLALVAVVRDEDLSAKDLNRTGLQNLLEALPRRQRDFEAVVVT